MEVWAPPTHASIHSYAVTYNPKEDPKMREKMKRFYVLVTKLLCCMECRKNAVKELKKLPIDNYLKDNESLFLWTWTLHDDINRRLGKTSVSYQKAKDWYFSRKGKFCESHWRMLHSFAVTYTPDLANDFKEFVQLFVELSCNQYWRVIGQKVLKRCPIDKYLQNNDTLFLWTWTFHDEMNKELSKKNKTTIESIPYQKMKDWYFEKLSPGYNGSTQDCKSCAA